MTPYFFLQQNSGYATIDQSFADLNSYDPATSNYTWNFSGSSHRDVRAGNAQDIRQLGTEATVLLKNSASLPLSSPKVIAVFGNDAGDLSIGLYNSADLVYAASPGFDIGTLAVGGGSGQGRLTYVVPPLEAVKARGKQDGAFGSIHHREWSCCHQLLQHVFTAGGLSRLPQDLGLRRLRPRCL